MPNLPVPAPPTVTAGFPITGTWWNANVRDALNFLLNPPLLTVYQSTVQNLTSGTMTTVSFNSISADTYSGWNSSTYTYTCQAAGYYDISVVIGFKANSDTAQRLIQVQINNATYPGSQGSLYSTSGATADMQFAGPTTCPYLNVGDTVRVQVRQLSGVTVPTAAGNTSALSIRYRHA